MTLEYIKTLFLFSLILLFSACDKRIDNKMKQGQDKTGLSILKTNYGYFEKEPILLFQLKNKNAMVVELSNYGGIITKILVSDKNGSFDDVVLGYDSLASYIEKTPYFGAFIGRFANRIAKGEFHINDVKYQLATNNGANALHGGIKGFDKKIWNAEPFKTVEKVGVILSGISPDGEEGYPGNLKISVKYTLNNENELRIDYFAETDQTTVINFSNHSYFNLQGAENGSILEHELTLYADTFTPVDETSIPTGERRKVESSPFDFRKPTRIGEGINRIEEPQIKIGNGYDHNFIINKETDSLGLAASVYEPISGRVLEVFTTEPGVQFYTANYLGGKFIGKKEKRYQSRDGFCLETQHFPNSPNEPDFPNTFLEPNEKFVSTTIFRFSTR